MTRVLFLIVSILLIGLPQTSLAARDVRNYDRDLHKVQTCIKNGEFAAAEALIGKMLVSFPANPELLSIQARLCFWEKDYDKSIEIYHKLLGKTPTRALREELEKVLVARELCDIDGLLKSEKTGEAENRLEKLYLSSGGEYEVAYRLGTLSLENREYGRALQVFAELRRRYPRDANTEALYIKALLFRGSQSGLASQKQEDFSTAEKLLAAQLAIQPDNPDLLFLQARFFFWEKRYDESIATYRKLLSLQPSAEAETGLKQVAVAKELSDIDRLLQSNELKAAQGLLETLYKAGAPFEAGHRLGLLYLRQGDYAGSLRVMGELRKQYPDDPGIEAPYIEALYFSGDVSAALAAVKEKSAHPLCQYK